MNNKLSIDRATMLFNERVLDMGRVTPDVKDTESMLEVLQFNKIFRSNTDEFFKRHSVSGILPEYLQGFSECNHNISELIHMTENLQEMNFEARLSTFRKITNKLTSTRATMSTFADCINWEDGQLYFISSVPSGDLMITTADPSSDIFTTPIHYHDVNGELIAWLTEECIADYLESVYGPTVIIRLNTSIATGNITRMEFNGDIEIISSVTNWLDSNTVVIENNHLYIDDLCQVLQMVSDEYDVDNGYDSSSITSIFGKNYVSKMDSTDPKSTDDLRFSLDKILKEDIIMEYPSADFDAYLTFLRLVSIDDRVKQLSMCLYRFGDNPIIFYLIRESVRRGIRVIVNVEVNASGEAINQFWVRELEHIGAIVINSGEGHHKVHAKLTSVLFHDGTGIAQIGTGNYHWKTATQYNDLSLFTSNAVICTGVQSVFDMMISGQIDTDALHDDVLIGGHVNAEDQLIRLINEQAVFGSLGYICIKANSFDGNSEIAAAMEGASQMGCHIDMIIRGACTWVPSRLSNNVVIKSIVGEQLEHARVYQFGRGVNAILYIGSLDPIIRKLHHRIEVMIKIHDADISQWLQRYLSDYHNDDIGNSWYMTVSENGDVNYSKKDEPVIADDADENVINIADIVDIVDTQ